ncbi:hypothetical protein CspHIS471_0611180 [Cutaneotrichosporon sp. HIS471]|nr:hypothetical protein CspHIS471_0611180 [Cutaneotrichosporon sp. HIS471]
MFELPPKRKRGRSPGAEVRPRGVHKRGKRIVSLLATLQRGDEPEGDPQAASLLGVPGLTRQALDACVAAFFGSTRHTKGRPERNPEPVGNADSLINAIEGMQCYADTASVVGALRDALVRAESPDAQPALVHDLVAMLLQHGIQTPFSALEI